MIICCCVQKSQFSDGISLQSPRFPSYIIAKMFSLLIAFERIGLFDYAGDWTPRAFPIIPNI